MNIIRLAWDYPFDGRPQYGLQPVFTYLSKAQVRMGNEVHVLTPSNQYRNATVEGIQVHGIPTPFNLNAPMVIKRLTDGEDWIIHSHATCGMFMYFYRRLNRVPLVSHVHGTTRSHHTPLVLKDSAIRLDYSTFDVNYHMLRERVLWSAADRVLAVSKSSADDIISVYGINPERVKVVYNGVDTDIFRPVDKMQAPEQVRKLFGKRIVLFVGHFGLRKGIFLLIRALGRIKKEIPDAHLLCIGGVPKWLRNREYWDLLRKEIEKNDVTDSVTLLDKIPNQELPAVYSASEIFVLPSYYETFSKVCLEAMACEKPVISTNMGGLPEVVVNGVTGKLVPYGSVNALTQAVIELLQDEKRSRQMGREGRRRVLSFFTWSAVAERIQHVYEELTFAR
ncbi:MAG: glycosyltransferase family 4 protein [Conexivisphaerales archaeon]